MSERDPRPRLFKRSFDDRQRQRAFALVAALLLAAAIALSWTGRRPAEPQSNSQATATTTLSSTIPAVSTPVVTASRPAAPRRPARRLRRVARRFLAGYLPYLYGQAPASAIKCAAPALRRHLVAERLRVPPAARRRRPHARSVRVGARVHDARAWPVLVRVADGGVAVYPIELLIGARRGRLVVISTGGE